MSGEDERFCYPKEKGDGQYLTAEPHHVICHCGRRIEQDEKGKWRHV